MQEYSSYLQQERGLAAAAIRQHLWWARRFLNSFYKANQVRLASLRAEQIADFVRRLYQGLAVLTAAGRIVKMDDGYRLAG
jgi:hypothetical protein